MTYGCVKIDVNGVKSFTEGKSALEVIFGESGAEREESGKIIYDAITQSSVTGTGKFDPDSTSTRAKAIAFSLYKGEALFDAAVIKDAKLVEELLQPVTDLSLPSKVSLNVSDEVAAELTKENKAFKVKTYGYQITFPSEARRIAASNIGDLTIESFKDRKMVVLSNVGEMSAIDKLTSSVSGLTVVSANILKAATAIVNSEDYAGGTFAFGDLSGKAWDGGYLIHSPNTGFTVGHVDFKDYSRYLPDVDYLFVNPENDTVTILSTAAVGSQEKPVEVVVPDDESDDRDDYHGINRNLYVGSDPHFTYNADLNINVIECEPIDNNLSFYLYIINTPRGAGEYIWNIKEMPEWLSFENTKTEKIEFSTTEFPDTPDGSMSINGEVSTTVGTTNYSGEFDFVLQIDVPQ